MQRPDSMLSVTENQLLYKIHHPTANPENIVIEIPPGKSSIAVMFSAGVESTLVLTLIKLFSDRVRPLQVTAFTVEKSENYEYYAAKILALNFFSAIKHVTKVQNARSDGVIREGITRILNRENVDLVFTGLNRTPDVFIGPVGPKRDSPEFIATIPKLRCPVLHLTKDYTVSALRTLNELVGTDLYSMTHTCTESRTPCRHCWFCKERAWAESVLC